MMMMMMMMIDGWINGMDHWMGGFYFASLHVSYQQSHSINSSSLNSAYFMIICIIVFIAFLFVEKFAVLLPMGLGENDDIDIGAVENIWVIECDCWCDTNNDSDGNDDNDDDDVSGYGDYIDL